MSSKRLLDSRFHRCSRPRSRLSLTPHGMVLAFVRVPTRARAQRRGARYRNRSQHPTVRSTLRARQIRSPPKDIDRNCVVRKERNRSRVDERFAVLVQKPAKSSALVSSTSTSTSTSTNLLIQARTGHSESARHRGLKIELIPSEFEPNDVRAGAGGLFVGDDVKERLAFA